METFYCHEYVISNKFITFVCVKYKEFFKILKKDGWFEVRQKGSHVIMQHPTKSEQLTVPYHAGKEVKKGLLTAILKQAKIKNNKEMKRPKIKIKITKENTGYSATALVNKSFITTEAETFEDLKAMILEAVNLTFEDKGFVYTIDEIKFEYDLESFFDFYKIINAKALSERIGMSQSLLAQYIRGIKKPSITQTKRILQGVQQIGRELSEVRFLYN